MIFTNPQEIQDSDQVSTKSDGNLALFEEQSGNNASENLVEVQPYQNQKANLVCNSEKIIKDDLIINGYCQFGDYRIEFLQYLSDPTLTDCGDRPFCGLPKNLTVTDSKGKVLTNGLEPYTETVELYRTAIDLPYLVLLGKTPCWKEEAHAPAKCSDRPEVYYLYTFKSDFQLVDSISTVSYLNHPPRFGFYLGVKGEILVDVLVEIPPPINGMKRFSFLVTHQLFDGTFRPIPYDQDFLYTPIPENIWLMAIESISVRVNREINDYPYRVYFSGCDRRYNDNEGLIQGSNGFVDFFNIFVKLLVQEREDMAWHLFDKSISDEYDNFGFCFESEYETKKDLRLTLKKWADRYFPLSENHAPYQSEVTEKDLIDEFTPLKSIHTELIAAMVKYRWEYEGRPEDWGCDVSFIQDHNGFPESINIQNCNSEDSNKNMLFKESIQRAVFSASPFPVPPEMDTPGTKIKLHFRFN